MINVKEINKTNYIFQVVTLDSGEIQISESVVDPGESGHLYAVPFNLQVNHEQLSDNLIHMFTKDLKTYEGIQRIL